MRPAIVQHLIVVGMMTGLLLSPSMVLAQRGGGGGHGGGGHMGGGHMAGGRAGGGHMQGGRMAGSGHMPAAGRGQSTAHAARTPPRNNLPIRGKGNHVWPAMGHQIPHNMVSWTGQHQHLGGGGCTGGDGRMACRPNPNPTPPPPKPTPSTGGHITTLVLNLQIPTRNGIPGPGNPGNRTPRTFVPMNPLGLPLVAAPPTVAAASAPRAMQVPVNALPNRPRTQIIANSADTLMPIGYAPFVQLPSADPKTAANTGADLLALQTGTPPDRAEEVVSLVSEGLIASPAHAKAKKMAGICLVNPIESGGAVGYLLNGTECQLKPGQVHQLPTDEYTIEFDKGVKNGSASYNLTERTYVFYTDAKKGWDLYSKAFTVTLDNTANLNSFAGLLDGKEVHVGPRQSRTFKSPYPLLLAFDPGDGSEPSRRWLTKGSYKVGIGAQTALLDLFSEVQATADKKPATREVAVE